jgi:hypothetical protein
VHRGWPGASGCNAKGTKTQPLIEAKLKVSASAQDGTRIQPERSAAVPFGSLFGNQPLATSQEPRSQEPRSQEPRSELVKKAKSKVQGEGLEPSTYCVLSSRHNHLDHPCTHKLDELTFTMSKRLLLYWLRFTPRLQV